MIRSYFSPNGGCETAICREISRAKSSIYGAIYSFTNPHISQLLLHQAMITKLIIDPGVIVEKGSMFDNIKAYIEMRQDKANHIMHNKFLILDERVVITGSYNWSLAAERENAENLLVIPSKTLASDYLFVWNKLWAISLPV